MNLGVSVANQDTWEAIRLHQKALEIRETSSKYTQDQIQSRSLNYLNIGRCWWMVKDLEKAAESFQMCLDIIKEKESALGGRRFAQ